MQVTTIERKLIHSFWVTNGSIRLSTVKNGQTNVITHISDLEELFPGNEILSDKVYVLALYVSPMRFSLIFFFVVEFGIFYGFIFINIGRYFVICQQVNQSPFFNSQESII